jgi:HlyD family secretion protein
VSESEYDLALAAQKTAQSALGVGEATIEQVKAAQKDADANIIRVEGVVMTARAARDRARTNLDYCTIKSPVKGVILDRRVNVGQTVVSSLNAPSLFLLAKDLKKIQIWASVNEADIMQVRVGQPVTFTIEAKESDARVDRKEEPKADQLDEKKADPRDDKKMVPVKGLDGRTEVFNGTVHQIRLNANNTQNVITYTVVINTDNSDGRLWPSMSANVLFEVARRKDVLKVPQAALRWNPRRELVSPAHQEEADKLTRKRAGSKKPGDSREGVVWVEDGPGLVRPVKVEVGMSDGILTAVKGELTEEDHVVLGTVQAKSGGDDASPFAPRMFGGKKPEK